MINLIKGDMFFYESDLLVVPCNTNGGMTHHVYKNLDSCNYPILEGGLSAGTIVCKECGMEALHKFVAYAAAVEDKNGVYYAKLESVNKIISAIMKFCKEKGFKTINMPLLGTGAGRLPPKDVYECINNIAGNSSLIFNVFAFGASIYNELILNKNTVQIKNPRVFISYTGLDLDNRKWVKDLAVKLRMNGVDAHVDMFHLKHGADLPQWMTDEIICADKVILICDKYYIEKSNSRKGGVGWETMLIQGDMLSSQNSNKFIAIMRENNTDSSLPIFMKSKYAIPWNDDSSYDENFRTLLECLFDYNNIPQLGEIPDFIKKKVVNN